MAAVKKRLKPSRNTTNCRRTSINLFAAAHHIHSNPLSTLSATVMSPETLSLPLSIMISIFSAASQVHHHQHLLLSTSS
ncbi:putative transcription factor sre2 [Fusarium oxysporum f. sp. albedinis]|nr:putative transcription factor sre2 [Fusarium oxysporum f. sp. albedinis]